MVQAALCADDFWASHAKTRKFVIAFWTRELRRDGGNAHNSLLKLDRREAVLDDAGGDVVQPLTNRRPSGSSARNTEASNGPVWCMKVRRTLPLLTSKSVAVLSAEPESACWLSGSATESPSRCAA